MPKTAEILGRSAVLYGGEFHFQTTGPVHQHRRPSPTVSCTAMYCVVFVSSVFDCGGDDRLTTCLENLEMSGNLTAVTEMSGILLKIREMSGKKSCWGKVA